MLYFILFDFLLMWQWFYNNVYKENTTFYLFYSTIYPNLFSIIDVLK